MVQQQVAFQFVTGGDKKEERRGRRLVDKKEEHAGGTMVYPRQLAQATQALGISRTLNRSVWIDTHAVRAFVIGSVRNVRWGSHVDLSTTYRR